MAGPADGPRAWRVWSLVLADAGLAAPSPVGAQLVAAVEADAHAHGATVLVVELDDPDDESGPNGGVPGGLVELAALEARATGTWARWLELGFRTVGMRPEALGPGRPGLTLARTLLRPLFAVKNISACHMVFAHAHQRQFDLILDILDMKRAA